MPSRMPELPQKSPTDLHLHPFDQNNVTALSLDVHCPLNKTRVLLVKKTGRTDNCKMGYQCPTHQPPLIQPKPFLLPRY